jgi:protein TonB
VSCSSNEAAALARPLTPRLAAALAASAALHVLVVVGLGPPAGVPWGELPLYRARPPLRAVLLVPAAAGPAPEAEARARPAREGTVPRGPRYYSTRELDVQPLITTRVHPEYPETAARRFLSGKVRLQLYIDETGAVERVQTLAAEPLGYFEGPAHLAFRAARFTPGRKDGKPVKVQMTVEVSFDSPQPPEVPARR